MHKFAALSPAIQALEQTPSDDSQKQAFEQRITEMAYKTFGAQFPDQVENIITFRMLDSNADNGSAFGAFIIDLAGETVYAPVVAVDSQLRPIEILYSKTDDTFVPFTPEWVDEIQRNAQQSLGAAAKLPETVPTDVDIRNLVVPPTTGRYSYAQVTDDDIARGGLLASTGALASIPQSVHSLRMSALSDKAPTLAEQMLLNREAETLAHAGLGTLGAGLLAGGGYLGYKHLVPSEEAKTAAAATEPLARALCKRAEEQFDPNTWQSFVEQFSRQNGVTPGVALDQGQMDLNLLTKMYKSHVKTWQIPQEAQEQAAQQAAQDQAAVQAAQGQAQQGASQDPNAQAQPAAPAAPVQDPNAQAAPPVPSPAGAIPAAQPPGKIAMQLPPIQNIPAQPGMLSRAGGMLDTAIDRGLEGAAMGGAIGGLTGMYDEDYSDLGGRMMRGAAGGGLGNVIGTALGHRFNMKHPTVTGGYADELGSFLGTVGGSIGASRPDGFAPRGSRQQAAAQYVDPYADPYMDPGMYRMAAANDGDPERDTILMVKHAAAVSAARPLKLLGYLDAAPNAIKLAFSSVLQANRPLLKFAAETYGAEALLTALRVRPERAKSAGIMTETFPGLRVTESRKGSKAFGERSPLAFRGVQLRGYYYQDARPAKNLAVFKQEYHDTHDAREPGVYKLWKHDGSQEPALVLQNPIDLLEEGRPTFPSGREGVTRTERYAPGTFAMHAEPTSTASTSHPRPDVERSHKTERLIIHSNGKYCLVDEVHGEQVTEAAMKGSAVYNALFTDKKAPVKAGLGFFAYKKGAHYYGTLPVKVENVSRDSSGVLSGKLRGVGMSWGDKYFRIDPRSPMGRLMRPRGEDFVVIPATWRWVPLEGEEDENKYLYTASAVIDLALNRLGAMGAHEAIVVSTGADRASIKGKPDVPKVAALKELADTHEISGADAEAMLKIAELEGSCRALIVPKAGLLQMAKVASPIEQAFSEVLQGLQGNLEQLQGQVQVLQSVQQRAQELSGSAGQDPTQMQQTDPAMAQQGQPQDPNAQGQPMDPNAQPAPGQQPADPNAQQAPGQQPMDPNAQAQGAPQAQLGAPGGMPPGQPADPNAQAQGAPQGQPMDPNAQAAGQQPMDPNAQQQQPPLPMMASEGPSSQEIAQQVNPTYLNQAAQLQNAGVFDAGALAELERASGSLGGSVSSSLKEHTKDLAETVDDLGRTLLTMQLRASELQEQLSDQGFEELEQQVRNSFKGLGKLLLDMNQHASALTNAQATPQ